ncbi:MAG: hypothetical protein KAI27_00630 [Rhodospirillaceae bacterium]|nr:hypothetical protein [Rhodospirillaceae bacterium]
MSLFKVRNFLLLLAAVSVLSLPSCGYRPLYGQAATNPGIKANLSAIDIAQIPDRIGQKMHTELGRRLHPRGQLAASTHNLKIVLSESSQNVTVAKNTSATRANMRLTAKYQLVRLSDRRQVFSGSLFSVVSHNILGSDYATLVAKNSARDWAINDLGEQLERRMAIYFTNPTEPVINGAK